MPRFQIIRLTKRFPADISSFEATQGMLDLLAEYIGPRARLVELRQLHALLGYSERKTEDWLIEAIVENPA